MSAMVLFGVAFGYRTGYRAGKAKGGFAEIALSPNSDNTVAWADDDDEHLLVPTDP